MSHVPAIPAFPIDNPKTSAARKLRDLHREAQAAYTAHTAALQAQDDARAAVRIAEQALSDHVAHAAQEHKPPTLAVELVAKIDAAKIDADERVHAGYIIETARLAEHARAVYDDHRRRLAPQVVAELRDREVAAVADFREAQGKAADLLAQAEEIVAPARLRIQRARSGAREVATEVLDDGDLSLDAPLEHPAIPDAETFAGLVPVRQRVGDWTFEATHGTRRAEVVF